ncbi:alpha/beta hydrolase [Actinomadura sp. ATCC 31491]|uniref:Alpha/beta hydrolase n=1 Tax=Actinomadura luzonensis TaxID=2805427 RepID=A0ABT0FTX2_9ACTN|nr:alpha/beta hydrolase [Actinomadura luzonensis]MCK2215628.1 alpha/beta hydrolase [Actinomadura luzonensis]
MTEFLKVDDGQLAYDVAGEGPLIVLAHGIGNGRSAFRHLTPSLVEAGYRVAALDMRGHGESSLGWPSYTRTGVATDLAALIRHLGGPAVVVGHSFAGGSATIVAARHPELVSAVVEVAPFTRVQKIDVGGLLRNARHRRGIIRLMGAAMFKSIGMWMSYLDVAYPGVRPADHAEHLAALEAELRRPGRMDVVGKMGQSAPADAGEHLAGVRRPTLIVMGTHDPDWADPETEANGIVAAMAPGVGGVAMIEGAGHYPHAQYPAEVARVVLAFLGEQAVNG